MVTLNFQLKRAMEKTGITASIDTTIVFWPARQFEKKRKKAFSVSVARYLPAFLYDLLDEVWIGDGFFLLEKKLQS